VSPLLQALVSDIGPFSALSGGVVLGAMILPFIASLSDDPIFAVPLGVREAGYALGGTKLAVVLRVVLPNATSGIFAAAFLGTARAMGETMIVLIACGLEPSLTLDPRAAVQTLAAFIAQATISDAGTSAARLLFFVAAVLFVFTFVLNAVSARWRRRFLRRLP
jgi:phosphate transport system permease protein